MSTFTSRSASGRKSDAAIPGLSGTPYTVTLDCEVSGTTAEIIGFSMFGSSFETHVPVSQVKADRTCNGTSYDLATSTDRIAGFGHPTAVISSNSSKLMLSIFLASAQTRGSVVKTPGTSV